MRAITLIAISVILIGIVDRSCGQEMPRKAQRYFEVLTKRPRPGTVFDRFHAAWLEERGGDDLLKFFGDRAARDSATPADRLLLAVLHEHRGDDQAALKVYTTALELEPANGRAWMARSRLESRALDFTAALSSLDAAAKADPDADVAIEIGKLRGQALLRLGRNDDALRTWRELVATRPDDGDLAEDLIDLLTDEGQYEAAVSAAEALIEKTRDPIVQTLRQLRLSDILLLAERRDDALKVLATVLRATGADSWIEGDVLSRISRIFRMEDDIAGLETCLAGLLAEHPHRTALAWRHTEVLGESGQKDAALKSALAILKNHPGRVDLREHFLDLLESLGLMKEAVVQASILLEQNPNDRELFIRLATLQHRVNDDAAALITFGKLLALEGAGESDYLRVARLLETWEPSPAKPDSEAAKAYLRMIAAFPASLSAKEAQALYFYRNDRRDEALAIWRELASSANLNDLLRLVQTLQSRLEPQVGLDLLIAREAEFGREPRFLSLLVTMAIANKAFDLALSRSRTLLDLARDENGIDTALRDIRQILRLDPDGKRAASLLTELQVLTKLTIQNRCLLAVLLETGGKSSEAEKLLLAAPESEKVIALSQLVQIHQDRKAWEKAADIMQQIVSLPGARTTARLRNIVGFYRRAFEPEEALKWIAEWKKLAPGTAQIWLDESLILLELGRTEDALALLRGGVRKFPEDVQLASRYAKLCFENGRPDEAERIYLSLYEKATDIADRLQFAGPLARAAQSRNALPRLIENFRHRQQQNRASAQPWLVLAEIHRATHRDEDRRRCLYEASKLRPQDISLLHEIARSETEIGRTKEALSTLEAAAKLDNTTKTRERIARLQIESGDPDIGYRILFELAGGDQIDARGIERLADTIVKTGDWERVVTFLDPLLPKHPQDYRLIYLNAVALEEAGRELDALRSFLTLLDLDEEIPGIKIPQKPSTQPPGQLNLPAGTKAWLDLPEKYRNAYRHRNQYSGGYYGNPQRISINHPVGVALSRELALAHILEISAWLAKEETGDLEHRLHLAGIENAALLIEASRESPQLLVSPEMLAAQPENETLHAVWLVQNRSSTSSSLLPGFENAWKLFKESDFALEIALRAWELSDKTNSPWLKRIVDLTETMQKVDTDTYHRIARLLMGELGKEHIDIPIEKRSQLGTCLTRWYRSKDEGVVYNFRDSFGAYVATGDWEAINELLVDSIGPSPYHHRAGLTGAQALQGIPDIPLPLSGFLGGFLKPQTVDEVQKRYRLEINSGLKPFAEQAKDPRLRLVLQILTGNEDAVLKTLRAKLADSDANVNDALTAGWIARHSAKPSAIIEFLSQAAKLSKDESIKKAIDETIILTGLQIIGSEPDEKKTEKIRRQLKTLISAKVEHAKNPRAQYALAESMQILGMNEELRVLQESWQKSNSLQAAPTANTNPYSNRSRHRSTSRPVRIEDLVKQGDKPALIKALVTQIRPAIQQCLDPQNKVSGHRDLHRSLDLAKKYNLTEELKSVFQIAASNGWRPQQEFAVFLEHSGKAGISNDAVAEHWSVVTTNPRAWRSHIRLAVLRAMQDDIPTSLEHWNRVPKMIQAAHLPGIMMELSERSKISTPQPRALGGLLAAWLSSLDPKRPLQRMITQQMPQALDYIQRAESGCPSLYTPYREDPKWQLNPDGSLKLTDAGAVARIVRREAHDDLCRAMMNVPELTQIGFSRFAGIVMYEGADLKEIEKIALDLLNRQSTPAFRRRIALKNGGNPFRMGVAPLPTNGYQSKEKLAIPSPAVFATYVAASRKDTELLEGTIYPAITKAHGYEYSAYCRAYATVLMAPENEFISAANAWLNHGAARLSQHSHFNTAGVMDEVIRIWAERKIVEPLDDFFFPSKSQTPAARSYVQTLLIREPDALRRFARRIRSGFIGDDAAVRRELITDCFEYQKLARNRSNSLRQPGAKLQATQNYLQWLGNTLREPNGISLLELALEDGVDQSPDWLRNIAGHYRSRLDKVSVPEALIQFIDAPGFLREAEQFRAFDLSTGGEQRTWLGDLAKRTRDRWNEEQLAALLADLNRRPAGFGTDLIEALLVKKDAPRSKALRNFLTTYADDLAKIPAHRRGELSSILRAELVGYPQTELLGAELTAILAPILKTEQADLIRQVGDFLAIKTWSEIRESEYTFVERYTNLLSTFAPLDSALAGEAAHHAVALLQSSPEQIKQAEGRAESTFVAKFIAELAKSPQLISTTISLAEKAGLTKSRNWCYQLNRRIDECLRDPVRLPWVLTNTPFVAGVSAFRDFQLYDKSEPTLLAQFINDIERNIKTTSIEQVSAHLNKQPSTFGTQLLLAFLHRGPDDGENMSSFYYTDRPDNSALIRFIKERSVDFAKLQPDTAVSLLYLLEARMPDLDKLTGEDAELRDAMQILVDIETREIGAEITRWLNATTFKAAGIDQYEAARRGVSLLDRIAPVDQNRAVMLFDHICQLYTTYEAANDSNYQSLPAHRRRVARWLTDATAVPELFEEIMARAKQSGAADDSDWLKSLLSRVRSLSHLRNQSPRVVALFEEAGMLNPAMTFTDHPIPKTTPLESLLQSLVAELRSSSRYFRDVPGELSKQPVSFGRDLIVNAIASNNDSAWEAFFAKYADDTGTLTANQRTDLAGIFYRLKVAYPAYQNLPSLRDELSPYIRQEEKAEDALRVQLVGTKTWAEFENLMLGGGKRSSYHIAHYSPHRPYPPFQKLQEHLRRIVRSSQPTMAKEILLHVAALYRDEFADVQFFQRPSIDSLIVGLIDIPELLPVVLKVKSDSYFPALDTGRRPPLYGSTGNETALMAAAIPDSVLLDPARIISILEKVGLLVPAEELDLVTLPGISSRNLLRFIVRRILTSPEKTRADLIKKLIGAPEAVFGHHLIAALLTGKDDPNLPNRLTILSKDFADLSPSIASNILGNLVRQFGTVKEPKFSASQATLESLRQTEEDTFLRAIKAGSQSVSYPYRGPRMVITGELEKLMDTAPEQIVPFLESVRLYLDLEPASTSVSESRYKGEGTKLSNLLRNCVRMTSEPASMLAVQYYAAARMPEIRLQPDRRTREDPGINNLRLHSEWGQRGGWVAPGKAFRALMGEIGKSNLTGTKGLWLESFHYMLFEMGSAERAILASLAAQNQSAVYSPELALACTLLDGTEAVSSGQGSARFPARADAFARATTEAEKLLGDESIAPDCRLSLAAFFVWIYPGLLETETIQKWGEYAANLYHQEEPVTAFELETLLNAASTMPANNTWQRTAKLLTERWEERRINLRRVHRSYFEPEFYYPILRFATRSGDIKTLEDHLEVFARQDMHRVAGILLENGDWKHARLIAKIRENSRLLETAGFLKRSWLPVPLSKHTSEDDLLLEAFALTADDTETRIQFPDHKWPEHKQRYEAFAAKLSKTKLPADPAQRAHSLTALGFEAPGAATALLPQFEEVANHLKPDSFGQGYRSKKAFQNFTAIHMALKIAAGDYDIVDNQIQKLVASEGVESMALTLLTVLGRLWDGDKRGQPLAAMEYLLKTDQKIINKELLPVLKSWKAALENEPVSKTKAGKPVYFSDRRLASYLDAIAGSGSKRFPVHQRLLFVLHLVQQTSLHANFWKHMIDYQIISVEELIDHRAILLQHASLFSHRQLASLAEIYRKHGDFESAAQAWKEAIQKLKSEPKGGSGSILSQYHLDLSTVLIRRKKHEEARQYLTDEKIIAHPFYRKRRDAIVELYPVQ